MFLSKISIDRPVLVVMCYLVLIVFGILAYIEFPVNLMPEMKIPFISISTVYAGAGPREVETQITKVIEDAVSTVSQIDYIQSYSLDNVGITLIKFDMGKDVNVASQEVSDKIDAIIANLPDDAEKPAVQKLDVNAFPFMLLVLSGDLDGRSLYELADKNLKDKFSQLEGVATVDIVGGYKRQINVTLKDRTVYENSLSLAQLNQILAASNLNMPAGQFVKGTQEYSVRLKGEYNDLQQLRETDIPTTYGVKKLKQLADVEDSYAEVRERAIFFNAQTNQEDDNVIMISLTNSSDGNVVKIAKSVKAMLPELKKELPQGVELNITHDLSEFTQSSVSDTLSNIIMGILLTGLILLLFLHDIRSTLIVAVSIPISMIATFVFMQMSGFTLNMMTLMGLSTTIGMLVANSIVVLENIFRHKDMGHHRMVAAERGTSEVAIAVLASTLTNVVVFLPIATMSSMIGQVFKEFGLTVTYATLISLLVSFTITPMMASRILPHKVTPTKFGVMFENWFNKIALGYERTLAWVLRRKKRAALIILATLILFIASFSVIPIIGTEMIPTMDQGYLNINVELPQGASLDQTAKTLDDITKRVSHHKEIKYIVTSIGSQGRIDTGTNLASSTVQLVDAKERKLTTMQMVDILIKELASVPNAKIAVSTSMGMGGGSNSPIDFYVKGTDTDRLEELRKEIVDKIRDVPGLINLDTSSRSGKSEITVIPDRVKMAQVGATTYDLAIALRTSVNGNVMTRYREAGNEYDINLSLDDASVDSPEKIRNLPVTIYGKNYILSQLADVTFSQGVNKIIHRDKAKAIEFTGYVAEGTTLGDVNNEIKRRISTISMPLGYGITYSGISKEMEDMMYDMMRTLILAILLTYMLMGAILESFSQPLIIIMTVPMAMIGVFASLLITKTTINIVSMMGIIMLVGIVVNNAILLLDYANQKRREGWTVHDSVLEAGRMKLKPIIMSTLAIVIGMLPMAVGMGAAGKQIRQPLGIVSFGGMIVSTALTLYIIPALYFLTTKAHPEQDKIMGNVDNQSPEPDNNIAALSDEN
ncbi:MAG TPA: efflux RND transporter permease subunit [Candidatus Cloacimonadota bacterium]|nr:efflux RND transporter permease subunit [Candidatus Cloacimonadota bacterium]